MTENEFLELSAEERNRLIADALDFPWDSKIFPPDFDDPKWMMRIVERMREEGWEVYMAVKEGLEPWCHLGRNVTEDWRKVELYQARAETLPKAVQLASLRAVGAVE